MTTLFKWALHRPPPRPRHLKERSRNRVLWVSALNILFIGHYALYFFPYSSLWIDQTWAWALKGFRTVIIGSTPAWREWSGDETKQKAKQEEKTPKHDENNKIRQQNKAKNKHTNKNRKGKKGNTKKHKTKHKKEQQLKQQNNTSLWVNETFSYPAFTVLINFLTGPLWMCFIVYF